MTSLPQKDRGYEPSGADPLVRPGSPPHRQQTCPTPHQTRLCHRMVMLATRASSRRKMRPSQVKYATVMLIRPPRFWITALAGRSEFNRNRHICGSSPFRIDSRRLVTRSYGNQRFSSLTISEDMHVIFENLN